VIETHWTGKGSLCGWRIWWSCYNIYHRCFPSYA